MKNTLETAEFIQANNNKVIALIEAKIKEHTLVVDTATNPITANRYSDMRAGLYDALFLVQDNTLEAIRYVGKESEVVNG